MPVATPIARPTASASRLAKLPPQWQLPLAHKLKLPKLGTKIPQRNSSQSQSGGIATVQNDNDDIDLDMVDNEEEYQNFNNLYQNSGLSSGESSPYLDKEDILSEADLHNLQCGIIEMDELSELSNASDDW